VGHSAAKMSLQLGTRTIKRNPTDDTSIQEQYHKELADLLLLPENRYCADCGTRGPRWASTNLGVFLCIRCSGIHRSLGVHISYVKSVSLDKWKPEHVQNMKSIGNAKAKQVYEASLPNDFHPPIGDDHALERWLRRKYEFKEFMDKNLAKEFGLMAKESGKSKSPKKKTKETNNKKSEAAASSSKKQSAQPINKAVKPPTASQPNQQQQNLLLMDTQDEFSVFQSANASIVSPNNVINPIPSLPYNTPAISQIRPDTQMSAGGQATFAQQADLIPKSKASKEDIMQLFHTPIAPTPTSFLKPQMQGPNYNVRLEVPQPYVQNYPDNQMRQMNSYNLNQLNYLNQLQMLNQQNMNYMGGPY